MEFPDGESMADSLSAMMYGAGEDENPLPETVACMQHLVAEYVGHVTSEACMAAEVKGKLDTECFVFAVRHDKPKFKRVKHILESELYTKSCTSMRFADANLSAIFHPSFEAVHLPEPSLGTSSSVVESKGVGGGGSGS